MRALINVQPSPEQLALFSYTKPGAVLIRGAAGSGKTTTALLKLRTLIGFYLSRRGRSGDTEPIRVLVLTYNTTLKGYIEELTNQQVAPSAQIEIEIQTFAKWAKDNFSKLTLVPPEEKRAKLFDLCQDFTLPFDFLEEEIEYVVSKFLPEDIDAYLSVKRDGRGSTPRVEKATRELLINNVIKPYYQWKQDSKYVDWNDLAVLLIKKKYFNYDIVVTDETQDFSANQIRAIMNQLAKDHSVTFVLDTAQRIYARGFTWQEAGVTIRSDQSHRLSKNYRNTVETAQLAYSILKDLPIDDDATIPDFSSSTRHGPLPLVLSGKFSKQLEYVLNKVIPKIDLKNESVAFLHPKGYGWFDGIRVGLTKAKLDYVEITRSPEWPQGPENIALSTIHSAKGLEFDHVIILGLNSEVTPHGEEDEDDKLCMLRRLLAMGVGRARMTVTLGYKATDKSALFNYIDPKTYQEIIV